MLLFNLLFRPGMPITLLERQTNDLDVFCSLDETQKYPESGGFLRDTHLVTTHEVQSSPVISQQD